MGPSRRFGDLAAEWVAGPVGPSKERALGAAKSQARPIGNLQTLTRKGHIVKSCGWVGPGGWGGVVGVGGGGGVGVCGGGGVGGAAGGA